jgi:Short C-terminal domain
MPGLLRGVARVAAISGTATAVSNRVSRRQSSRWAAQDTQSSEPAPAQAQAPPSAPSEDRVSQLKDLADLKAQGVLTDQEFAAEKARILGQ